MEASYQFALVSKSTLFSAYGMLLSSIGLLSSIFMLYALNWIGGHGVSFAIPLFIFLFKCAVIVAFVYVEIYSIIYCLILKVFYQTSYGLRCTDLNQSRVTQRFSPHISIVVNIYEFGIPLLSWRVIYSNELLNS